MMFNNLGIYASRQPVRRAPAVVRRPAYPIIQQFGGNGQDFFINGGTGPIGPPGPPGPAGPPGNPSPVTVTDVATATYTALPTDYFLCVLTIAPVVITLPTGILGTVYIVKDCAGNAQAAPIVVQGTGQNVDIGTATINVNFGSLTFIFNGTEWSIV